MDVRSWIHVAGEDCVAVKVPANAYLDTRGSGWTCERGFKEAEAACVALRLPANAHVDYSGNDWSCDDGFSKRNAACAAN